MISFKVHPGVTAQSRALRKYLGRGPS